jgi:hypothetical protein
LSHALDQPVFRFPLITLRCSRGTGGLVDARQRWRLEQLNQAAALDARRRGDVRQRLGDCGAQAVDSCTCQTPRDRRDQVGVDVIKIFRVG